MEELEQEELDKELLNTGKTPITDLPTPAVPTSEPSARGKGIFIIQNILKFTNVYLSFLAKTKVEEDDDEMKELANWAS